MKYLLDTNIIIMGIGGEHAMLRDRMAACDEDDLVTSAVVYAEVVHGSKRGKPPPLELVEQFVAFVPVLPFDRAAARAYATLPFRRSSYDRLIAAHALSLGLTMVTANDRDFTDVPDLKVENWTT